MKHLHRLAAVLLMTVIVLYGCAAPSTVPSGPGWITLIDGENGLQNWNRTGDGNWRAADGAIQIDSKTNKDAAFLYSRNSYTDFEMYVEFWADEAANSGVFYRITNTKIINTKGGYEVQIFDKNPPYPTASLVNVAQAAPVPAFKAAGRWNTFTISVQGPRMIIKMNGEQSVDVNNSVFPTGPIGLQYNSGTVKFRKLMIRAL
jgi:Domain of Unknown Function (DUF1080)